MYDEVQELKDSCEALQSNADDLIDDESAPLNDRGRAAIRKLFDDAAQAMLTLSHRLFNEVNYPHVIDAFEMVSRDKNNGKPRADDAPTAPAEPLPDAPEGVRGIARYCPASPTIADAYMSECEGLRLRFPGQPIHLAGHLGQFDYDTWEGGAGEVVYVIMTPAQAKVLGLGIVSDPEGDAERLRAAGYELPTITPTPAPGESEVVS